MIVFGSSISPFVRKVLAFGAEKGLDMELQAIGLGSEDPDFCAASPFRKMPGFKDGDFSICDSSAIVHYLEAKFPEPNLIPTEPRARARTVWFDEFGDTIVMGGFGKMFFNRIVAPRFLGREGDHAVADQAEKEELPPILDYLDRTVPESGFLVEDRLTLADIAVASPFVNLGHMQVEVDAARWPKARAYVDAILARPSFAGWVERERAFFARAA
jgi:glutathione S-transferase